DAKGRLWYSASSGTFVVDHPATGKSSQSRVLANYDVGEFTMEENGVVWMWSKGRLTRYDPSMPDRPETALKAAINLVQFTLSRRNLFSPGAALPPIDYEDNSFVVNFGASSNPFGPRVTFEIMLENGHGGKWIPLGSIDSYSFNDMKEGKYV